MEIKVCGMRNSNNIKQLLDLNIDYIGFIFYEKSSRYVGDLLDEDFIKSINSIKKVGVFVNSTIEEILVKKQKYNLNYIQLHGNESAEFCKKINSKNCKIIKSFSVDNSFDFSTLNEYVNYCEYFLFDTKGVSYGGNGVKFNWGILGSYKLDVPIFLSGGVDLHDYSNVKKLENKNIKVIDINSRFELEPGLKNIIKIKEFITRLQD